MFLKNQELRKFLSRFKFKKRLEGCVGIEREHFLVSAAGLPVPRSPEFLKRVRDPRWTYELSACQVEVRTRPRRDLSAINLELLENDNNGRQVAEEMGLKLLHQEVADAAMPLGVYPNPRYRRIVRNISKQRLRAACRVAGTHLHLGVKNISQAIALNNAAAARLDELCRLGDHSAGERLRLYKTMAENCRPVVYGGWEHFFETARAQGFVENPRNCWQLIRISVHGTVELRMFGCTEHIDEVLDWVTRLHSIASDAGVKR